MNCVHFTYHGSRLQCQIWSFWYTSRVKQHLSCKAMASQSQKSSFCKNTKAAKDLAYFFKHWRSARNGVCDRVKYLIFGLPVLGSNWWQAPRVCSIFGIFNPSNSQLWPLTPSTASSLGQIICPGQWKKMDKLDFSFNCLAFWPSVDFAVLGCNFGLSVQSPYICFWKKIPTHPTWQYSSFQSLSIAPELVIYPSQGD